MNPLLGLLLEFFPHRAVPNNFPCQNSACTLEYCKKSGLLLLEFLDTIQGRNLKAIGPDISASDSFPPSWLGFLFRVFYKYLHGNGSNEFSLLIHRPHEFRRSIAFANDYCFFIIEMFTLKCFR